jgi:acetoin utilization deacetylase AcuC-like enzyme
VLVIDLDVHQGDGTANIFRDDSTVFTLSLHGARNFPARKAASDLDVGLPDGCTDTPYLHALDEALGQVWSRHGDRPPQLAFYLSGADPHEADRLGRLSLTSEGLAERDRRVLEACRSRGVAAAVVMGGGYGRDIGVTVGVHLRTLQQAAESWRLAGAGARRTMEQSGARS